MTESVVKVGHQSETLVFKDGVWQGRVYVGDRRKLIRCKDLDKARQKMKAALEALRHGAGDLATLRGDDAKVARTAIELLTVDDLDDFRKWAKARRVRAEKSLMEVLEEWSNTKLKQVGVFQHKNVRNTIISLKRHLTDDPPINSITHEMIGAWIGDHPQWGRTTICNYLTRLKSVWAWAQERGYVAEGKTAPHLVGNVKADTPDRGILTPDQLDAIYWSIPPNWRPWVMLTAFGGQRPMQLATGKKGTEGLRWDDIKLDREIRPLSDLADPLKRASWGDFIRVREDVSKTRSYMVPIPPNLRRWIEQNRPDSTGPVMRPGIGHDSALRRLVNKGVHYTKDCLRHSCITYIAMLTSDPAFAATAAGTGLDKVHKHYWNRSDADPKHVKAWFSFDGAI